ncbi:MAG: peroxidase [Actinobacteria bacterium]|nr:peroxidase [Actinomycetota bacterium]
MTHHRRGLRRLLKDDEIVSRIEEDFRSAGLESRRVAMLEYAEKLTLTPKEMDRSDVDKLRSAGFADGDILALAEVTGYYAYVNRIADGLGVEVEPWFVAE